MMRYFVEMIHHWDLDNMEQQILASIIQFASCTFLLFAVLLWMQRGDDRSRIYFSVAYAVAGIDLFLRIFTIYSGKTFVFEALQPATIYMALIEIPLFLFYLIEVINPGWLTCRKIGLLCAPWILWNICLLMPGLSFRELDTFGDIFRHIGETNVWLRLLFAVMILPYNLLIYRIPYNWRRSSADRSLVRIYGIGFVVMALFFIGSSVSGLVLASSLHLIYGTVFCFYIAYYELFTRLQVPKENTITADVCVQEGSFVEMPCAVQHETDEECQPNEGEGVAERASEGQWRKFNRKIEEERPWRNPDMSIATLADLLQTNRTTLSRLFQEQGYSGGYKEYINRRRIDDFLELMDEHPQKSMQDAFFEVGYRSRMTALRNFKEYMGMGPSEYFSSQIKEE